MSPGLRLGGTQTDDSWMVILQRLLSVGLAIAGTALLVPAAATPAKDAAVSWTSPTPGEGAVLGVAAKTTLSFRLSAASDGSGGTLAIRDSGSPQGAVIRHTDGDPASATFTWRPPAAQTGVHRVTFSVSSGAGSATRTVGIRVGRPNKPPPGPPNPAGVYPQRLLLSDRSSETYRWAFVRHRTVARTGPSSSAHGMTPITFRTPELYRNAIQVLNQVTYKGGRAWVRIRLAVLPNSTTGWVPRGALTAFQKVHKRMVISQRALRATLYSHGRQIFSARVGVGQPQWPTPRGEFYIREKLSGYYAPAYGPRAFGLNAKSNTLIDWPGGGFVGIHGTNEPQILPGRVSHGCVRMRNPAILRLFRLMPLGTPVSIR